LGGSIAAVLVIVLNVPNLILPLTSQTGLFYRLFVSGPDVLAILLIALSFSFAILRYRLYDIDLLINRTLVYGTLTVILTVVYAGLIIGLAALLRGVISQDNSVAIVISTIVIYALSQPLRKRIQGIIDRRFYRRKYDAARTLAAFSATLRTEVELSELREHLVVVVRETMQPTHVSLWLRTPEHTAKQRAPWRATPPVSSEGS